MRNSKIMTTNLGVILAVLLYLIAAPVLAHHSKAALTTVLFNPRTSNIEIMHRFSLHDAEHAVRHIFDHQADIIGSVETQQRFNDYVQQRFSLQTEQGKQLPLASVGYEIEGKFFWVYQETAQPLQLTNLKIRHDALRDLWPSQVNTINIEGKGDLQTVVFKQNVELLKVEF